MKKQTLLRGLCCLVVTLTGTLATHTVQAQDDAVTATVYQTVNIRGEPDTRAAIVGQLGAGDVVMVEAVSEDGRWLRVAAERGDSGWVPQFVVILDGSTADLPVLRPGETVETTREPLAVDDANVTVTATAFGRVNVRSGPGMTYDITTQLGFGDTVEIIARNNRSNDWLFIETETFAGWVAFFTVNVDGDPGMLPVRVPDPDGDGIVPPANRVVTRFNALLRTQPDPDAPIILTIPFDTPVEPLAKTDDEQWLYIGFENIAGWGFVDLFVISPRQMSNVPVFSEAIRTPEPTPADESGARPSFLPFAIQEWLGQLLPVPGASSD